ncbi:hypothetical protein D3C72_1958770 [compost metagenome]
MVGVGSVGTRCMILLMVDQHDKPLFLQVKEATRSVVARFFKGPQAAHEGRRVVEGQRLMQAASDLFLGWTKGPFGRHFYMRQLRDMKLSPQLELMDAEIFGALRRAVRLGAGAGACQGQRACRRGQRLPGTQRPDGRCDGRLCQWLCRPGRARL